MTDGMYLNPKPVKTADDETVETAVEYSLVDGTYGVRLDPDVELLGTKPRPRLTAAAARQLAADLAAQADEADRRNGAEPAAFSAQLLGRVHGFLREQLDADDMSLEEIAGQVITMVLEG